MSGPESGRPVVNNLTNRLQTASRMIPGTLRVQGPGGWRRLLVAALFAYLMFFTIWLAFLSSRVSWAGNVDSISPIISSAIALGLIAEVVVRRDSGLFVRRAWFWILIASISMLLGHMIWAWYELVLNQEPFPSWADAAYLGFYPLMMIGLLRLPATRRQDENRVTFWLDIGVVLVASFMVVWYFVLGPTLESREPDLLATVLSVAYPLGDILVIYAVARLLLRGSHPDITPAARILLPAALVLVAGDLGFAYLQLNDLYTTGHWIDLSWVLSGVLFGLAAYVQVGQPRASQPTAASEEPAISKVGTYLPYAAMVLGYGTVLTGTIRGDVQGLDILAVGATMLSVMVIVRQIVAFNENHRLLQQSMALSKQLQEQESQFRSLVQHGSDIILLLDADSRIQYISPSILRVTGVPPASLEGMPLLERLHPDDRAKAQEFLRASALRPGFTGTIEVRVLHQEGSWLHVEAVCSNQLQNPNVAGIVINARDITDRKMLQARLVAQANHDDLTGLPNRRYFVEMLQDALEQRDAPPLAVLFLDLDRFKIINDSLGHSFGDELLIHLAERLRSWARPGLTPARLGGDEFTVLVTSAPDEQDLRRLTDELQQLLDKPYVVNGQDVTLSPSIGIATGRPGRDMADDILRRADIAMYREKADRRSLYS